MNVRTLLWWVLAALALAGALYLLPWVIHLWVVQGHLVYL
jgi:hypothetical protein